MKVCILPTLLPCPYHPRTPLESGEAISPHSRARSAVLPSPEPEPQRFLAQPGLGGESQRLAVPDTAGASPGAGIGVGLSRCTLLLKAPSNEGSCKKLALEPQRDKSRSRTRYP